MEEDDLVEYPDSDGEERALPEAIPKDFRIPKDACCLPEASVYVFDLHRLHSQRPLMHSAPVRLSPPKAPVSLS